MKNYLTTIILVLFLLLSFVSTGCKSQASETESIVNETAEQTSETTIQIEETTPESTGVKTPVVMMVTPEEVYRIITEGKDHFLLDVRTVEEYNEGHIEGAYLIPVQELENRLGEIPGDKQIIVYCRSGGRSSAAANILMENGFGMVYDMGGILEWQEKGYPVVVENVSDDQ